MDSDGERGGAARPLQASASLPASVNDTIHSAANRWLKNPEVVDLLENYRTYRLPVSGEPPAQPAGGTLYIFNRKECRFFRKDGHNWRKKPDGKTVRETHEKLKVGNVELLNCYYAHADQDDGLQRRCYWLLDETQEHIVLVHYLNCATSRAGPPRGPAPGALSRLPSVPALPQLQRRPPPPPGAVGLPPGLVAFYPRPPPLVMGGLPPGADRLRDGGGVGGGGPGLDRIPSSLSDLPLPQQYGLPSLQQQFALAAQQMRGLAPPPHVAAAAAQHPRAAWAAAAAQHAQQDAALAYVGQLMAGGGGQHPLPPHAAAARSLLQQISLGLDPDGQRGLPQQVSLGLPHLSNLEGNSFAQFLTELEKSLDHYEAAGQGGGGGGPGGDEGGPPTAPPSMKRAGSGFSRLLELWREASGATSGGGGLSQGNAGLASWLTALSSLPAANSLPAWSADLDLAALEAAAANNPELQELLRYMSTAGTTQRAQRDGSGRDGGGDPQHVVPTALPRQVRQERLAQEAARAGAADEEGGAAAAGKQQEEEEGGAEAPSPMDEETEEASRRLSGDDSVLQQSAGPQRSGASGGSPQQAQQAQPPRQQLSGISFGEVRREDSGAATPAMRRHSPVDKDESSVHALFKHLTQQAQQQPAGSSWPPPSLGQRPAPGAGRHGAEQRHGHGQRGGEAGALAAAAAAAGHEHRESKLQEARIHRQQAADGADGSALPNGMQQQRQQQEDEERQQQLGAPREMSISSFSRGRAPSGGPALSGGPASSAHAMTLINQLNLLKDQVMQHLSDTGQLHEEEQEPPALSSGAARSARTAAAGSNSQEFDAKTQPPPQQQQQQQQQPALPPPPQQQLLQRQPSTGMRNPSPFQLTASSGSEGHGLPFGPDRSVSSVLQALGMRTSPGSAGALAPPPQPQVLGGGAAGPPAAPPAGDAGSGAKGGVSTLNGGREAAAADGAKADAAGGSSAEEGRPAFVISDYTPEWDYTAGGAKVMITGELAEAAAGQPLVVWFGEQHVESTQVMPGVLRCTAPAAAGGRGGRVQLRVGPAPAAGGAAAGGGSGSSGATGGGGLCRSPPVGFEYRQAQPMGARGADGSLPLSSLPFASLPLLESLSAGGDVQMRLLQTLLGLNSAELLAAAEASIHSASPPERPAPGSGVDAASAAAAGAAASGPGGASPPAAPPELAAAAAGGQPA